jgi:hypothetical protein
MGTHGTIQITSKRERGTVLLQTPSDGHTDNAVKMLRRLPAWIARQKKWRPYLHAQLSLEHGNPLTLEAVQDFERHSSTCELCIIELAAWIVAYHPMRWRVVPPQFQRGYLADFDRVPENHLRVRILDDSSYTFTQPADDRVAADGTVNLIEEIHKIHLRMAMRMADKMKAAKPARKRKRGK